MRRPAPAGCDKLPTETHSKCKGEPAMKKNSIVPQSPKRTSVRKTGPITSGMDLGDAVADVGALKRCRIAMEVGTHSPWVSRLLKDLGHEAIGANARQVKLISVSSRRPAGRANSGAAGASRSALLRPIQHRSEKAQGHPGAGGVGGSPYQPGEHGAGAGQSHRRAVGAMRHRSTARQRRCGKRWSR